MREVGFLRPNMPQHVRKLFLLMCRRVQNGQHWETLRGGECFFCWTLFCSLGQNLQSFPGWRQSKGCCWITWHCWPWLPHWAEITFLVWQEAQEGTKSHEYQFLFINLFIHLFYYLFIFSYVLIFNLFHIHSFFTSVIIHIHNYFMFIHSWITC